MMSLQTACYEKSFKHTQSLFSQKDFQSLKNYKISSNFKHPQFFVIACVAGTLYILNESTQCNFLPNIEKSGTKREKLL